MNSSRVWCFFITVTLCRLSCHIILFIIVQLFTFDRIIKYVCNKKVRCGLWLYIQLSLVFWLLFVEVLILSRKTILRIQLKNWQDINPFTPRVKSWTVF